MQRWRCNAGQAHSGSGGSAACKAPAMWRCNGSASHAAASRNVRCRPATARAALRRKGPRLPPQHLQTGRQWPPPMARAWPVASAPRARESPGVAGWPHRHRAHMRRGRGASAPENLVHGPQYPYLNCVGDPSQPIKDAAERHEGACGPRSLVARHGAQGYGRPARSEAPDGCSSSISERGEPVD